MNTTKRRRAPRAAAPWALAVLCSAGALAFPALAGAGEVEFTGLEPGWEIVVYDSESFNGEPGSRDDVTITKAPNGTATVDAHGSPLWPRPEVSRPNAITNCVFAFDQATCRGNILGLEMYLRSGDDVGEIYGGDLYGGAGDDVLRGGAGSTDFRGDYEWDGGPVTPGADTFVGGGGYDEVWYSGHPGPITVTLDGLPNDGIAGEGDNVGANIEAIHGSGSGADTLIGDENANYLYASGELSGLGGADYLMGSGLLNGGAGPDRLFGRSGSETLDGGAGEDAVESYAGDDLVRADDGERDTVDCGEGNDTVHADPIDVLTACEVVNP